MLKPPPACMLLVLLYLVKCCVTYFMDMPPIFFVRPLQDTRDSTNSPCVSFIIYKESIEVKLMGSYIPWKLLAALRRVYMFRLNDWFFDRSQRMHFFNFWCVSPRQIKFRCRLRFASLMRFSLVLIIIFIGKTFKFIYSDLLVLQQRESEIWHSFGKSNFKSPAPFQF